MLWRELTERHREIYQEPTIGGEHPEEYFDKYLNKVGPARIWIAIIDSEVVGLTGLDVSGYEAEIEPLIVTKAHRNKGVGTKLLEKVIAEARTIGISLNVSPVARNVEAIRFFHKAGFNKLGRVADVYRFLKPNMETIFGTLWMQTELLDDSKENHHWLRKT